VDKKQKNSQPAASRNVRVTAEFRANPDIEKLARAFIAIAKNLADRKTEENEAGMSCDKR